MSLLRNYSGIKTQSSESKEGMITFGPVPSGRLGHCPGIKIAVITIGSLIWCEDVGLRE